ncbi:hypothetical protein CF168_15415 [Shewanella bicestrii]|uniref:DNA mimic protein DMP19 C-terminal domain-containing protein n=2 Tax=Shewanella bicestrii TaxID=2018305 RepID=A0A220UQC2_9GAMM|nr:hypothetical protein CF168_15415 [Shewanella bicestrii]
MRKLLIILTAISGLVMAKEYPESYDAVSEKYEAVGFSNLSEKEQAIYTIWWLEAEVNNGGFHQYFWNSSGEHAVFALKSLNNIGATKTASLLQRAIDVAFNGKLPESRLERQNHLKIDEDSKMGKLGNLDSEFYEYSENFYEMLDVYVAK